MSRSYRDLDLLAAMALVVIGAVGGFLLGAEGTYRYYQWRGQAGGGEALMAAAYGAILIGGPVGALVGIASGVLASRRLAGRVTGAAAAVLIVAAGALVAWAVKLANGW